MNALNDSGVISPTCPYCGQTHGLRIASEDPWGGHREYICEQCFRGTDTGPSFDDLAEATPLDLLSIAQLRHDAPELADKIAEAAGRQFDRECRKETP